MKISQVKIEDIKEAFKGGITLLFASFEYYFSLRTIES